jgi:hypothetical protein
VRALAVIIGVAIGLSACSSSSASRATGQASSTASTAIPTTTTTAAPSGPPVTLDCHDVIHDAAVPYAASSVIFDRVVLPTGRTLQVASSGEKSPSARLFAKQGLLIRPDATFEMIVPAEWSARLTIGWGNPGRRTHHLVVTGCPAPTAGAKWLAFAGGYWVAEPACVPVIVRADGREQLVHIAVGTPCPSG